MTTRVRKLKEMPHGRKRKDNGAKKDEDTVSCTTEDARNSRE